MGQKTHSYGFRLGVTKDWKSHWFAERSDYSSTLHEDWAIRNYIKSNYQQAGISLIEVERKAVNRVDITIHTARPGMLIGRGGSEIENIRKNLINLTNKSVFVNVIEVKNPELNAQLVAENIATQIEKRISYKRAMKQAINRALKAGAKGIKIMCGGRLNGAEISRSEWFKEGRIPLQTLTADIDYGFAEALTISGVIGIKVWIYRGDLSELGKEPIEELPSKTVSRIIDEEIIDEKDEVNYDVDA
ncbi:MAG TPA: 30S ribosomal protein S3 [Dictyoglomaceae bacterium]|nr:30S ribosomal protein S3 [Dictyoglomaceae bacterium]HOL38831.1 30S ribosomal protein S3 [Dictyoglomaceae bacterium]HOP94465.1 30S ribosomal protein S3 [Dictyoglomaceae bacterium]HPP15421.1 30S ribosomal protein S3 [Dictyoglomaceae bacterium]HPU43197.1 30S ribosomal protein S3 [Dictyoglomaceae bacterium]